MMHRVCVVGAGAIGSLYAAHLARVTNVHVFVRRLEHARALNEHGLRVSGTHSFTASVNATTDPRELPNFDLGIVCTKATQTKEAIGAVGHLFDQGAVISAQNGLGSEKIMARHTKGYVIRATTFMSGTRHSDSHVEYELHTATWLGPFEPTNTPFALVQEAADLIIKAGLKAEALEDARPAQWSKLIFNASVNAVSALTELPHSPHFAGEQEFSSLGHLLHDLIDEGKRVAEALGIDLHEDPWKMNKLGARTNHPTSMLNDMRNHIQSEVDFLGGAIAREAKQVGISAPLHSALYRLIKGKEDSWSWQSKGEG